MFSMPPATATSMFPREISCAAETMACAPEPQTRLTVSAGVLTGSPAWTAACRAGFILLPAWTTLPMTTVSTSSGRSFARVTAAPMATEPRAEAVTSLSEPPKVPIAVRTGSAKTTERSEFMANLPRVRSSAPLCAYGSSLGAQRDRHIEQGTAARDAPKRERDRAEHEGDAASQPQDQMGRVSGQRSGYRQLGARVVLEIRDDRAHAGTANIVRRGTGCSR